MKKSVSHEIESKLNPEQIAAATHGEGPQLVLAGAGSGKTRTVTYRVAYLLDRGIEPEEVVLLTFTNKASREMLKRVLNARVADVLPDPTPLDRAIRLSERRGVEPRPDTRSRPPAESARPEISG